MVSKKIYWLVGLLVLMNIGLMVFLMFGRKHHKGPRKGDRAHMEQRLKDKLDLSDDQFDAIQEEREAHFEVVESYKDSLQAVKKELLEAVTSNESAVADSLANRIGQLHAQMAKGLNAHYQKTTSGLSEEQKADFKKMFKKGMRKRGKRRKMRSH